MTDKELITQLKTLRDIHPDKEWADLTRTRLFGQKTRILEKIFAFAVPNPLAISAMAVVVAVLGGVNVYNAVIIEFEVGNSPALTASLKHVADETASEVAEIQQKVSAMAVSAKASENPAHAVVFNKDAEERENFQALLRERIETKIAYVKDLFAQVEDGDAVREIMQNQRRYEENFKIFGEGLDEQVKELLESAEKALLEGDLITALDLVNAIDKLIKG